MKRIHWEELKVSPTENDKLITEITLSMSLESSIFVAFNIISIIYGYIYPKLPKIFKKETYPLNLPPPGGHPSNIISLLDFSLHIGNYPISFPIESLP